MTDVRATLGPPPPPIDRAEITARHARARVLMDTRVVLAVARSCTKISVTPLVSPVTRFVAKDMKATRRPSADMVW